MNDYNYNFSYDYENSKTDDEHDFTSPYHPNEKSKKKSKFGGNHLLTIIQITVCSIVLIGFALLRSFGGDSYTIVKNWYLQNINNSIVAQEQINTAKESFLHLFPSNSSSQATSSSASVNSQAVQTTGVLVSTSAATTHSVYSQVPVSLSVFLTPPLQNGSVTSVFGMRNGKLHKGMDIAAPLNTKIFCALPGKVESCAQNLTYGKYLVVDHGNDIKTLYAHCSSILVKKEDTVKYGQQIACVGSTGDSTGPHLHFELLIHQINYDPQPMLRTGYL